jgi:BirA family biotin operon repressor/biotin-[acetyl-CoA-carboxylase] ligase
VSRDKVYALLRQQGDRFCSGQELSDQLGISRTAVWKAVDALRRDGYDIEARQGLGYRLLSAPDALTEREVRRYLKVDCPRLHCFEVIDSTNSYLKREAMTGAPSGAVAVAEGQDAGRGRQGRAFLSPPGKGVYLSILLRPQLPPDRLLGATGMAAVAMCRAIEAVSEASIGIKWTNDLVLGGKKVGGILTEMGLEGETGLTDYLVTGIGINVRQTPEDFGPEVAQIATSLLQQGIDASRPALAGAMVNELYRLSADLGGDVAPWVEEYRRRCVTLGKEVRLLWSQDQKTAVAEDVDDQFGLVVRFPDGSRDTVRTGEVSVRGLYGYT